MALSEDLFARMPRRRSTSLPGKRLLVVGALSHSTQSRCSKQAQRQRSDLALCRGNFYTAVMNFPVLTRFSFLFLLFAALGIAAPASEKVIVLKAARLFDGKSKALVQNGV